jgi:Flp pilus assembly CpaF family ATPase
MFKNKDIKEIIIDSDGYLWLGINENRMEKTDRIYKESQVSEIIREIENIVGKPLNEENPMLVIDTEEWHITCVVPPISLGPSITIERKLENCGNAD